MMRRESIPGVLASRVRKTSYEFSNVIRSGFIGNSGVDEGTNYGRHEPAHEELLLTACAL